MEEQNKNDWNALHTIVHIAKYIICIIIFLYSLTGFYEGNIYTAMVLLFTGIIFLPFVYHKLQPMIAKVFLHSIWIAPFLFCSTCNTINLLKHLSACFELLL